MVNICPFVCYATVYPFLVHSPESSYRHIPTVYAVKVVLAACAIAVVASLGCIIATSTGARNILANDLSKIVIARDKKPISLDVKLEGEKQQGDLRGFSCPTPCRQVKGAVGNYLEAFAGFAYINLGLLVAQLVLNAAAMMCTCSKIIAHSYDTRTHVN